LVRGRTVDVCPHDSIKRFFQNHQILSKMTKEALKNKLENSFKGVAGIVENIEESKFFAPIGEKWSVAENILHLTQSVKMFNQAMALPKSFLEQQFGKLDRPTLSYDETIAKYQEALGTGVVARGAFVPQIPENPSKAILISSFLKHHQALADFLNDWSEEDLDQYCVKHPVLKNLSIREFYYFMDYHTLHHQKAILRYDA
jgi:DinB superfamily